ncbi:MAG: TraY domain-containing protein [Saezia sp.]
MPQTKKKTTVSINFEMSAETNQALTLAAKAANCSKHIEAALRLRDHLTRFEPVEVYEEAAPRK